jgi:hypothetical protein
MRALILLSMLAAAPAVHAAEPIRFEMKELDPHVGNVCYAVTTADVNGDGKLDVVALTEDSVISYENPTWAKHILIAHKTEADNVCIQAHDIDGDGRIDFALGAAWRPSDTKTGGTLQWLTRGGSGDEWTVRPIGSEPTLHRMRWGDVKGNGRQQLVVAPLQGRGTKGPNWNEGQGGRLLVFDVPKDPAAQPWPSEVAEDDLHTTHNLQIVDFDGDGRNEILIAAWEGVFVLKRDDGGKWSKQKIGAGNQETKPFKGASEVKLGRLADGSRYVATIEPWHGFQVVVYTPGDTDNGLWTRHVIDEPLTWGHAVWCANLDGDADEELIIGQRDPGSAPSRDGTKGPGVFVYDPKGDAKHLEFTKIAVDDGGVACEDLVSADLDGDGKGDIVAGGRATHNVRIYLNRGGSK